MQGHGTPSKRIQENTVFISYAREDGRAAQRLYNDLRNLGLNPWLDKRSLLGGQKWKIAIRDAIKKSRYFIALLSSNSVEKRGYVQRELKEALEVLDEFPESQIFVIPVRLDNCDISNQKLEEINYIDLFPSWKRGMKKIMDTVDFAANRSENLPIDTKPATRIKRYGWVTDLLDHRDHIYAASFYVATLPKAIDLIPQCPPIYDQGPLGSASVNAIAAAIEFGMMKENKNVFRPSRLFMYYNTRVMEGTVDRDSGAQIRNAIKSVSYHGDCPEDLWPYDIDKFAQKPPQRCYDGAIKHQAIQYQKMIRSLNQMKGCLASGYPFVFGFAVYHSFENQQVAQTGHASVPSSKEYPIGGHTVLAVGYDDEQNWFVVRNSWGTNWGMKGYFTLPYTYLLDESLSNDFWTIRVVG